MCNLELLNQINESICGGKKSIKSFLFEAKDSVKKRKNPRHTAINWGGILRKYLSNIINFKSIIRISFTDETKLPSDAHTQAHTGDLEKLACKNKNQKFRVADVKVNTLGHILIKKL